MRIEGWSGIVRSKMGGQRKGRKKAGWEKSNNNNDNSHPSTLLQLLLHTTTFHPLSSIPSPTPRPPFLLTSPALVHLHHPCLPILNTLPIDWTGVKRSFVATVLLSSSSLHPFFSTNSDVCINRVLFPPRSSDGACLSVTLDSIDQGVDRATFSPTLSGPSFVDRI